MKTNEHGSNPGAWERAGKTAEGSASVPVMLRVM